ncbi:MAG: LysR family transcriptional regulator [Pseudomonadota bacterium]
MQTPPVETDHLTTFVAVCEAGSFRAAAERVFRTPSAVSMQMAKLEASIGAALFAKDGRSVRLTEAGEEFLGYARRILSLHEEALMRVGRPAPGGLVRLGVPDDYELRLLTGALPRFSQLCPAVELEVTMETSAKLLDGVEEGTLDLAYVEGESLGTRAPPDLLGVEPLVWLGAAGGEAFSRRPLPLALPGVNCHWRHTACDALERAGIPYRLAFSCSFSLGQVAAVAADIAVSPMPLSYFVPGLVRLTGEAGLPELGTVSIRVALGQGVNEAAKTLFDVIRQPARAAA